MVECIKKHQVSLAINFCPYLFGLQNSAVHDDVDEKENGQDSREREEEPGVDEADDADLGDGEHDGLEDEFREKGHADVD